MILPEIDGHLRDEKGRYRYDTFLYYDGPRLFMREDTQTGLLQMFQNICDDHQEPRCSANDRGPGYDEATFVCMDMEPYVYEAVRDGKMPLYDAMMASKNHCFWDIYTQQPIRPLSAEDMLDMRLWPEPGEFLGDDEP